MAKKKSFLSRIITIFMVVMFLAMLTIVGLGVGLYLELFDDEQVQMANETVGLYKLPLVGANEPFEYFPVPPGVVWPEPVEEPKDEKTELAKNDEKKSSEADTKTDQKKSKDVKISRKEIEAQMKERETAEKKRISKLARIYNNMKPEEAARALESLSLDTTVLIMQKMDEGTAGQVLAKMNPAQAAQVTQLLFEGTQQRLPMPPEITEQPQQQ